MAELIKKDFRLKSGIVYVMMTTQKNGDEKEITLHCVSRSYCYSKKETESVANELSTQLASASMAVDL